MYSKTILVFTNSRSVQTLKNTTSVFSYFLRNHLYYLILNRKVTLELHYYAFLGIFRILPNTKIRNSYYVSLEGLNTYPICMSITQYWKSSSLSKTGSHFDCLVIDWSRNHKSSGIWFAYLNPTRLKFEYIGICRLYVWFSWFWSHFFFCFCTFENVEKCVLGGCMIT